MSKLRSIVHNPIIPVLCIVSMLAIGWYHYTSAGSLLDQSSTNIMPNAGLESIDDHGIPRGWVLTPATPKVTSASRPGYQSSREFSITNPGSLTDSTSLMTPSVDIVPEKLYLYKAFYRSTMPFDLVMRSTRQDGTSHLEIVRHGTSSREWTTTSHLFKADPSIRSVAFIYRMSAAGEFHIDNTYLQPDPTNVTMPSALPSGSNLLPAIAQSEDSWQPESYGDLQAASNVISTDPEPYLHLQVDTYKNGEAAWQHPSIPTLGSQAYQLQLTYKSSAPADVMAEYVSNSGKRTFNTITTLQASSEWTTFRQNVETPTDAVSVNISAVLRSDGAIDTREYSLVNVTKPGVQAWSRPLLSLTFDDGWRSAYQNAVPILATFGYKATFYLTPSALNTPPFMSSSDVDALRSGGHEIASHGDEHVDMTTLTQPVLSMQLSRAADYFHDIQKLQTIEFSTPFGATDAHVNYEARKYYASLRTTDDGINTLQNFDPYNLLVLYIGNDTPPAKVADAIADTQAMNGWLILVYHRVDTNTQGEPVIAPRQFQAHLDTIRQSHISVAPVGAALRELTSQQGT